MLEEKDLDKETLLRMLDQLADFDKKIYVYDRNNNSKIVDDGITAKIRKFSVQLSLMF